MRGKACLLEPQALADVESWGWSHTLEETQHSLLTVRERSMMVEGARVYPALTCLPDLPGADTVRHCCQAGASEGIRPQDDRRDGVTVYTMSWLQNTDSSG